MSNIKDEVFANYMSVVGQYHESESGSNLMINYLPSDMDEKELHDLFINFGSILKTKIIRDVKTGASCCYGFVQFELANNAKLAQMCLNGRLVRGKSLKVSVARPQSNDIKNAKVYIRNLPTGFNEMKLIEIFERCGNILDLNILRDKDTGRSRGIAFVHFEWRTSADIAISALNGLSLKNVKWPLAVQLMQRPRQWDSSDESYIKAKKKQYYRNSRNQGKQKEKLESIRKHSTKSSKDSENPILNEVRQLMHMKCNELQIDDDSAMEQSINDDSIATESLDTELNNNDSMDNQTLQEEVYVDASEWDSAESLSNTNIGNIQNNRNIFKAKMLSSTTMVFKRRLDINYTEAPEPATKRT